MPGVYVHKMYIFRCNLLHIYLEIKKMVNRFWLIIFFNFYRLLPLWDSRESGFTAAVLFPACQQLPRHPRRTDYQTRTRAFFVIRRYPRLGHGGFAPLPADSKLPADIGAVLLLKPEGQALYQRVVGRFCLVISRADIAATHSCDHQKRA